VAERVRLDIVFEGGASLSVNVPASTAEDLDRALASGEGQALSFEADDGRNTVNVAKILFARRTEREQVVGFGTVSARHEQ
jgi:hypothetical protein